jgi:2-oxo-4-hydroxy-4-carboxy--5-ureidoimidazoline (OHCU) decarboxylase
VRVDHRTDGGLVDPATLGDLDPAGLAAAVRPLWEDATVLADRLVGRRVATWEEHLRVAEAEIAGMDDATRAELLRAHPRLGTDPAALAARSQASWTEQGGTAPVEVGALAALDAGNEAYEARYGFPFVEWVAGRSLQEMATAIQRRLGRDRTSELDAGCAALVAIARDRLARIRSETP